MERVRAKFVVVHVEPDAVWIVDLKTGISVTNDAEAVVAHLARHYGASRRIFYRDTIDRWDELEHDYGIFTRFKAGCARRIPLFDEDGLGNV